MRVVTFLGALLSTAAWGQTVDLEWRAPETVPVGGTAELGLYAVAEEETPIIAIEVIFEWSATLAFVGAIENPPEEYEWAGTYFPVGQPGFDGLNDTWLDGDAYWVGIAQWNEAFVATPEGALVTTFEFVVADDGCVAILPDVGGYAFTAVWDAEIAAHNIVGELGTATITADSSLATEETAATVAGESGEIVDVNGRQ